MTTVDCPNCGPFGWNRQNCAFHSDAAYGVTKMKMPPPGRGEYLAEAFGDEGRPLCVVRDTDGLIKIGGLWGGDPCGDVLFAIHPDGRVVGDPYEA